MTRIKKSWLTPFSESMLLSLLVGSLRVFVLVIILAHSVNGFSSGSSLYSQQETRKCTVRHTQSHLTNSAWNPLDPLLRGKQEQVSSVTRQLPLLWSQVSEADSNKKNIFTHDDLVWKIRPDEHDAKNRFERALVKVAANLIRFDCLMKRQNPPEILCPKGGRARLEAHLKSSRGFFKKRQIARFGITTARGPPTPDIDETVREIYQVDANGARCGAVIYMFVEPEYRSQNVGELALEVISAIHSYQGCDFTILVADDNGSGKLVQWYEDHGFVEAPRLQKMMGSPDGQYGKAMMTPAAVSSDFFDRCKLKWW